MGVRSLHRNQELPTLGFQQPFFSGSGAFMGVPIAQKSDSWTAELAMADCGGLGVRPINGGRGGAVEQRESGEKGPPVSPPERVFTPPAPRMAAWRRMSSPGPLRCSTPR